MTITKADLRLLCTFNGKKLYLIEEVLDVPAIIYAIYISEGWVARKLATAVLWVRNQTSLKNHKWAT
jgi:hypothetical protein